MSQLYNTLGSTIKYCKYPVTLARHSEITGNDRDDEAMLLWNEKNGKGREDTLNDGVAERIRIREKKSKKWKQDKG